MSQGQGTAWLRRRIEHYFYDSIPKSELLAWLAHAEKLETQEPYDQEKEPPTHVSVIRPA